MNRDQLKFGFKVALAGLAALIAGGVAVSIFEANQRLQRRQAAVELAAVRGHLLQERVDRALSATYALAAVLRQGDGRLDNFEPLAGEMLRIYGGISSLQLAPDGVVSQIVPLAGNEAAIGHDLLRDPKRRKESLAAIESRQLTLAGPFTLRQGGVAVVGRLPVFVATPAQGERFWGFTIALIRIPDLLAAASLNPETLGDYAFELSRTHPDSGNREVFAKAADAPLPSPVSFAIEVPNGQWSLSLAPRGGWDSPLAQRVAEVALVLLIAGLLSLLTFHVLKQPVVLRREVARRTEELRTSNTQLAAEIDERRHAEAALRESEARFRNLADTVPVLIWMTDADLQFTYLNTAWQAFAGQTPGEAPGNGWQPVVHADDQDACAAAFARAKADRTAFQIECRCRRHDGEYRWLSSFGVPRWAADGTFTGFVGSSMDVSDLKQAALILRASRDELEVRVAERTAALTREIDERKRMAAALEDEKTEQAALIAKLGAAQNQLLQSEKMAAIGQLAAGVAHEINNPVGFIQSNLVTLNGYVDDLLRLVDAYDAQSTRADLPAAIAAARQAADLEFLREDLPALLAETREGVDRIRGIVHDLKDFAHVDSQVWQPADLHRGLDSTLNVVWNELKYKAEVVKEYGELPAVDCIASQINQVFMNLLVNAAHAIDQHGVITLRTGCGDDEVWVEVADTGRGIAPEHRARIFEPFFTTKPVGKGTGLGLSLSYSIVKKHGGRFDVDSEIGRGTRFRVWLPIRRPPESPPIDAAAPTAAIG